MSCLCLSTKDLYKGDNSITAISLKQSVQIAIMQDQLWLKKNKMDALLAGDKAWGSSHKWNKDLKVYHPDKPLNSFVLITKKSAWKQFKEFLTTFKTKKINHQEN